VGLVGLELPFTASLSIYSLAITVGALSSSPGSTETVMILLLGVSAAAAGTAAILLRLEALWFAGLLGLSSR